MAINKRLVGAGIVIGSLLSTSLTVFAQGNSEGLFEGFGKMMDEMQVELNKAMKEAGQAAKKAGEAMANMKPSQMGFRDDRVYSESELYSEDREMRYPPGTFSSINFKGTDFPKLKIVRSRTNEIIVTVTAKADPEYRSRARVLANALSVAANGKDLDISAQTTQNFCYMATLNGALSLKGSCYTHVTIAVPFGTKIAVYNDKKLVHGAPAPMSAAKLLRELDGKFTNEQLELTRDFAQTAIPGQLGATELYDILEAVTFDSGRYEAFVTLAPFLRKSERGAFDRMLGSLFMMSNERNARNLLGQLR